MPVQYNTLLMLSKHSSTDNTDPHTHDCTVYSTVQYYCLVNIAVHTAQIHSHMPGQHSTIVHCLVNIAVQMVQYHIHIP